MKVKNISQFISIVAVVILLITAISCTDTFFDSQNSLSKNDLTVGNSAAVTPNLALPDPYADSVLRPTVLGIHLPNPYLLTNMKQAYKNVTGSNSSVTANRLYVQFRPTTVSQLVTLQETLDLDIFDVPMDYQIITLGDYYQDASVPIEQITYQYAVVPTTFSFPTGIPYTILATIHIPTDTRIEAEAEKLAGLNSNGDDLASGANPLQVVTPNNAIVCPTGYHYDFTAQACVLNSCPTGYHWDATSGTCVSDTPVTPTYPGLPPAGSIVVWDTQRQANVGVRNVRVVAKRWFKVERMMTDAAGRFTATQRFRNKVKVIVKFKNDESIIRSIRGLRIWNMLLPLEFNFGPISGSEINTFQHQFTYSADVSSVANLVWNAATAHNAVQEHKVYAAQLGIGAPPGNLKIFLTRNKSNGLSAATPLFAKRAIYDIQVLFDKTYGVNYSAGAGVDAMISQYIAGELDIIVGYYTQGQNSISSDEVTTTMYHELSHAIHYSKAGNTLYTQFVNAELTEIANYWGGNTSPYGPGNNSVSGIIALGEGWAYHMGHFMANLKYGTLAPPQGEQLGPDGIHDIFRTGANQHVSVIELFDPNAFSDPFRWIPKGLMLDLIDNTPTELLPNFFVTDQVSGYTNQQIYNALDSDVGSVPQLRARLLAENSNSQSAQVITLFSSYGY